MLEQGSKEFQQSVCENFNTSVKQVEQDVETLRDWLKSQPHLPQSASDTMLKAYMIGCKNRMEQVKQRLDNYYTVRKVMPDIFEERDPLTHLMKECNEEIHWYTLPKLTPEGYRVTMGRIVTGDLTKYNLIQFTKRLLMMEDIKLNQEAFYNGNYFVFNADNYVLGHVLRLTPHIARELMYCVQDVLPMLIKGIIFINAPSYLDLLLNIMKPFMKGKLFQRIHVHTEGPEILEKYFPRALLPRDMGGEEETCDTLNKAWAKTMEDHRDWFLSEGLLTSDEKKRIPNKSPGKLKGSLDLQELQGSFKTLCID
uniref:CRAL-TRIO domain-containing protein n=1 Tax=Homalodisca liturata TaxID=320908 RepID=A0A1B6JMR4_9HEMI